MVYYFSSNTVSPAAHIYVGKDKVESTSKVHEPACNLKLSRSVDEELIKYGLDEDVW
jgi:hypothetical protein